MTDVKRALAEKLFSTMLDDLIMDTTLQAHKEACKRQAMTLAGSNLRQTGGNHESSFTGSVPPIPTSASLSTGAETAATQTNGSSIGSQKQDPTLLDCLNCKRPIAFNRYAPHLASCMGLNVGARRGQPRNASKRFDSEGARSASPQVFGDERGSTPSESKPASKRKPSPSDSSRESKRPKTEPGSGRRTPQPRPNGVPGLISGHYANSVPKASSKLRSSPLGSQGLPASPVASMENGYESDYIPSQQQSIISDTNSQSQPSADLYDADEKDPEYVIDVDGTVDTESDSDSGSD